ncbi:MAG: hypothetical protein AABX00_03570 [Nanoarchaeota archaeon]
MYKKAQGGINAALLVSIVSGLIILYIVFLPTADKEKLLSGETDQQNAAQQSKLLLDVVPGTLNTQGNLENDKKIPDIFLIETTNAVEIKKFNPFIVRNGLFDTKVYTMDFEITDPENTDNVVLAFTAKKKQGVLTVKLNDQIIFENEITNSITEPVKLDKGLLSKTNTLEFSVSSVGLKFWTTNEYGFENVRIIGDITDRTKQESNNVFEITESEFASLDKVTLKFTPYCSSINELGLLDIFVNDKKLFSSVPVCDRPYKQSVPKSLLNEGSNNIIFKTNKGSYSVEQISASLEFKDTKAKTYFFDVSPELYNEIKDGTDVLVSMKFTNSQDQKRLKMDINGKLETVETSKGTFSKSIANRLTSGNNYITLEPLEDVEVAQLRVEVQ